MKKTQKHITYTQVEEDHVAPRHNVTGYRSTVPKIFTISPTKLHQLFNYSTEITGSMLQNEVKDKRSKIQVRLSRYPIARLHGSTLNNKGTR